VTAGAARARPTRLVLLGAPVAHSLSPRFQNAALAAARIPLRYEAVHVEPADFDREFRRLAAAGAAGNVTIPHKEAAAAACDALTPLARRAGAVNTFWRDGAGTVGDNTDVGGFDALVRALLGATPANARVAVLGAGGSAAAVLVALSAWPAASVAIHARTPDRARALADRLDVDATVVGSVADAVRDATLVVNCTPLGMRDDALPVDPALLADGAAVADLVVRPDETPLVRAARARGLRALGGLEMLLEQGALAFERWLGVAPDRAAMRRAVDG